MENSASGFKGKMAKAGRFLKNRYRGRDFVLGIQHLFAMFGATVLVPILTGLNPSIALLGAGIGTIIFHICTKGKVPVFLGSSFAFIPAIQLIMADGGITYVQGAIIVAGALYLVLSVLVYFLGAGFIKKLFPPIVVGPVIIVIGLSLAGSAIGNASNNWLLAAITTISIIVYMIFLKGFFKLIPILLGILTGYLFGVIFEFTGFTELIGADSMNFAQVGAAKWWALEFQWPAFSIGAILTLAPVALVTFMEHIGDITSNGAVVGKDFYQDPGLHRTLLGDGVATMVAGLLGAPANTTYGENTGVLAVTKNYDPKVLRIAAVYAIVLGLIGKFGAILGTIPTAVLGGVSIVLFGMISAIGLRTLINAKIDFNHSRNMIIVALILVLGLGIGGIGGIQLGNTGVSLSGLFVATVVGIVANLVLPLPKTEEAEAMFDMAVAPETAEGEAGSDESKGEETVGIKEDGTASVEADGASSLESDEPPSQNAD